MAREVEYEYVMNMNGMFTRQPTAESIDGMLAPVQCVSCGTIYDSGPVEVIDRYADCDRWKQPCCSVIGDNRPIGWGGTVRPVRRQSSHSRAEQAVQKAKALRPTDRWPSGV